jgi:hypothetical protein
VGEVQVEALDGGDAYAGNRGWGRRVREGRVRQEDGVGEGEMGVDRVV